MLELFNTYSKEFFDGFKITLVSSLLALFFSLIIGTLLAICQTTRNKLLKNISKIYIEFFKNIPLLIIVMVFYVVLPIYNINFNGFQAGTLGLIIYSSVFIAENIRAGIQSVPIGQKEAAIASGFTNFETMTNIILPQAFKMVMPSLGNQFISLIKNSSVLAVVAGLDIMYVGDLVSSKTFNIFDTYIIVAIFYLIITLPLTYLMVYLEKRNHN